MPPLLPLPTSFASIQPKARIDARFCIPTCRVARVSNSGDSYGLTARQIVIEGGLAEHESIWGGLSVLPTIR